MTRWHRLIGIVSVLIVVLTTLTGIALNHTSELGLGQTHLASPALNKFYGQAPVALNAAVEVGEDWVLQLGGELIYRGRAFHRERGELRGAVMHDSQLFLLFESRLLQFDSDAALVDVYADVDGLAAPLARLGRTPDALVIETATGTVNFDPDAVSVLPSNEAVAVSWSVVATPPTATLVAARTLIGASGVTLEQVVLDLHSGRILGDYGVLLVDAAALALLFLALSGIYMWFKFKRGGGSPKRVPRPYDGP